MAVEALEVTVRFAGRLPAAVAELLIDAVVEVGLRRSSTSPVQVVVAPAASVVVGQVIVGTGPVDGAVKASLMARSVTVTLPVFLTTKL